MGVLSKGAGLNLYVRRKSFPVVDLVRTLSTVGDSPGKLPSRQHYKAHSLNHIFVSLCLYSHRQYPTLEMAPSVKLVYFPLRGRAELIRLILEAKGISYQDETIPSEKWGDKKASMPFRSLPVLYWDGEEIGQSLAIARFVAKKAGLAGNNDIEQARADAIVDTVANLPTKLFEIKNKDESTKSEAIQAFLNTELSGILDISENLLKNRGGKFFTGSKLSYGDIAMFAVIDLLLNPEIMTGFGFGSVLDEIKKLIKDHPLTYGVYKMVKSQPKIAEYVTKRPKYPF